MLNIEIIIQNREGFELFDQNYRCKDFKRAIDFLREAEYNFKNYKDGLKDFFDEKRLEHEINKEEGKNNEEEFAGSD